MNIFNERGFLPAIGAALANPVVQGGLSMGLGALFGKKAKAPEYKMPEVPGLGDLPHYLNLKQAAEDRISGKVAGFGDDFVGKATNPAIANIDANFQNRTLPTISSEASKRGLGRSSIVQDQIGQADQQRNRDINSLISQFTVMNEQQKKKDFSEGVGIAEGQRGVSQALSLARAGFQGQENQFNLGNYPTQATQQGASNLLGLESIQKMLGIENPQDKLLKALTGAINPQSAQSATSANTLNNINTMTDEQLDQLELEMQRRQMALGHGAR